MSDEELWKRRFFVFMLVRLAGLLLFFLGVAIAYSDLVREGGWPQLGAVLAICGIIDALAAPRVLKKIWERQ
jgi:hypothetical protein